MLLDHLHPERWTFLWNALSTVSLKLCAGLALLVAGVPIAFALAAAGVAGLLMERPWGAIEYLLATFAYANSAHFSYVVLPLRGKGKK